MSDRPCNKCVLEGVEALANSHKGDAITIPAPKPGFPNGVDVFVKYPGDKTKTFVCWFAELNEECKC